MSDMSQIVLPLVWFLVSGYFVIYGFLMIFHPKARDAVAKLSYHPQNSSEQQSNSKFVKYLQGPLYVVGGFAFLLAGLYIKGYFG